MGMAEDFLDIIMKKDPANSAVWDFMNEQARHNGLQADTLLLQISNVECGHKQLQQLIGLWGKWANSQRPYLSHHKLEQLKRSDPYSDNIISMANELRARAHTLYSLFDDMNRPLRLTGNSNQPDSMPSVATSGQTDLFNRHAQRNALWSSRFLTPLRDMEISLQTIYDDSDQWRKNILESDPITCGAFERYKLEQTLTKQITELSRTTRQTERSFVSALEKSGPATSRVR